MARGVSLGTLVDKLRKEVGDATHAALGANAVEHYKQILRRVQEQLWAEHDWPFLKVKRDIQMQAGVNIYAFPDDLDMDRVISVQFRNGSMWTPVKFGIGEQQYDEIDSDSDQRDSVVRRWAFAEGGDFEVWPIPAQNGQTLPNVENNLRIRGIKNLDPLVAESDLCTLDDMLIYLTAAAEILERRKSADAKSKNNLAALRLVKLKGLQSQRSTFVLGGGGVEDSDERLPRVITAYNDRTPE